MMRQKGLILKTCLLLLLATLFCGAGYLPAEEAAVAVAIEEMSSETPAEQFQRSTHQISVNQPGIQRNRSDRAQPWTGGCAADTALTAAPYSSRQFAPLNPPYSVHEPVFKRWLVFCSLLI